MCDYEAMLKFGHTKALPFESDKVKYNVTEVMISQIKSLEML